MCVLHTSIMTQAPPSKSHLIELLLRPIVRFCLERAIKFQEFSEVSRHLFVRCAQDSLRKGGHESNVSRVAVATGLRRREVARIFSEQDTIAPEPGMLHKVIGHWLGSDRFSDHGKPKKLAFKGAGSEFAELVHSVSQDLNAYTVLFELERLGMVRKEESALALVKDTLNPGKDVKRSVELLAADMGDLISAVEENVFDEPMVPNHHVKTHYDNIVVEALPKIRKWMLKHGTKFHREARAYLSKFDRDLHPQLRAKAGNARVAIGSFSIVSEDSEEKH